MGGVAAFDAEDGIISPGGIGFDVNCGVRLLATGMMREEVMPKMKELLERLFRNCPVGVGVEADIRLADDEYDDLLMRGAEWAVDHGYGIADDVAHCEANGRIPGAIPDAVSVRAKARGRRQLGTVGAGNHFIEFQAVDVIHDKPVANAFRITKEGQVVVLIHCGSRGFGHEICSDYIRKMEDAQPEIVNGLVDRNLIYAPLKSKVAQQYFGAMCCAANYAFANRHIFAHNIRKSFAQVFGAEAAASIVTVYDIAHNIAKKELHTIDGKEREVMLHRKGATRAFPPGHLEVPPAYRSVGQPVIIPGSMGTASYVLVGTETAMRESFGSTAHGAGRTMSRLRAKRDYPVEMVKDELERAGVTIKAASLKGISEEAPGAYKDVDEVIKVSDDAGLAKKVARMVPIGVIKG
ncbi:TPA: RtcB family protein [Candidatus Woesearchaeota archaeon]|nr:RtcB family protein [Candidatus Woesearchaeota archaeon]